MQEDTKSLNEDIEVRKVSENVPDHAQEMKKHKCPVCGRVVLEYHNDIVVFQCSGVRTMVDERGRQYKTRCKTKYYIKTKQD